MKFELNYSTKSFLDSELLDDLKKVACELNKNTLTMQEYETYGKFSSSSYQTRFGSWLKSLELAGLSITRQNEKLGKEEIIQDLKSIAKKLNKETLTRFDYNNYGKFSPSAISNHFDGSWLKALEAAGLKKKESTVLQIKNTLEILKKYGLNWKDNQSTKTYKNRCHPYQQVLMKDVLELGVTH